MTSSDIELLLGWFLGAFGSGMAVGFLVGIFMSISRISTYR